MRVTPLQPSCPWANWARPNVKYCEPNACSWITTPANTWTNLAYIFVGLWMLYDAKTRTKNAGPTLYSIGWAIVFVGITSFFYHASYT